MQNAVHQSSGYEHSDAILTTIKTSTGSRFSFQLQIDSIRTAIPIQHVKSVWH